MAKKYEVKFKIGKSIVHYDSPLQFGDYALCGDDIQGDESMGWYEGVITTKNVNCPNCLKIIKYCKAI